MICTCKTCGSAIEEAEYVGLKQVAVIAGLHRSATARKLVLWEAKGLIGHFGNDHGKRWLLSKVRELLEREEKETMSNL